MCPKGASACVRAHENNAENSETGDAFRGAAAGTFTMNTAACSIPLFPFFNETSRLFHASLICIGGGIAQLARAVALQAIGLGFKSPYLHDQTCSSAFEFEVLQDKTSR